MYQQQYQQPPAPNYGDNGSQYPPPPNHGYYHQQCQQNANFDYDPSKPTPRPQNVLLCHLPRSFGYYQQYIVPYEETLIVQNPCDFRKNELTIMNSQREPLFLCSGVHNKHDKEKKECVIRSTAGQDLVIVAKDTAPGRETTWQLSDAHGNHQAWMTGDGDNDPHRASYTVFMMNRLSSDNDSKQIKICIEGNFDGDHVDWTFLDTDNRFAMLSADFEQSGVSLPDGASGTRVAAGFDLAMVAGMQVIMDCHNTDMFEDEAHQEKQAKYARAIGKGIGKGLVKAVFSAAGGGGQ